MVSIVGCLVSDLSQLTAPIFWSVFLLIRNKVSSNKLPLYSKVYWHSPRLAVPPDSYPRPQWPFLRCVVHPAFLPTEITPAEMCHSSPRIRCCVACQCCQPLKPNCKAPNEDVKSQSTFQQEREVIFSSRLSIDLSMADSEPCCFLGTGSREKWPCCEEEANNWRETFFCLTFIAHLKSHRGQTSHDRHQIVKNLLYFCASSHWDTTSVGIMLQDKWLIFSENILGCSFSGMYKSWFHEA